MLTVGMLKTILVGADDNTQIFIDGAEVLTAELDMNDNELHLGSEEFDEDD